MNIITITGTNDLKTSGTITLSNPVDCNSLTFHNLTINGISNTGTIYDSGATTLLKKKIIKKFPIAEIYLLIMDHAFDRGSQYVYEQNRRKAYEEIYEKMIEIENKIECRKLRKKIYDKFNIRGPRKIIESFLE